MNAIFEDSVDFRSYGPQLFNHRVKLPLRREEVAQLAGVGVSWYTWLPGMKVHAAFSAISLCSQNESAIASGICLSILSSRQLFVDWEQAAQHAVMNFRAAYDQYIGDAWFEHFLADLQQKSPE